MYVFPPQIEPGSQTEQAPPSSVVLLSPEDMRDFRFLTISVAPRPVLLHSISLISLLHISTFKAV